MAWHGAVKQKLESFRVFKDVMIEGAKVRAVIDKNRFLEVYYSPITGSYSYGIVDLNLPHPGDKRVLGWDDYPHEEVEEVKKLKSYPHHFQHRRDREWIFEESPMRGNVVAEMDIIIEVIRKRFPALFTQSGWNNLSAHPSMTKGLLATSTRSYGGPEEIGLVVLTVGVGRVCYVSFM